MGRLLQIEVENFKSYKGHQIIGPFHHFTSVIGPNGSGKSNLMDAISFVLGVNSAHLRSHSIKDMIYRASALQPQDDNTSTTARTTSRGPRQAHVTAVFEKDDGQQVRFMRTAFQTGQSEYRINNKQVPYSEYNATLEKESILVKAKNFLVFQGDVESVASQNPNELTKLIEQISGSWEYKEEYDRLKVQLDTAVENNAHALNKKRGITLEVKQYRQQKEEAERFTQLLQERREMSARYLVWKLYHVEQKIHAMEEDANNKKIAVNGVTTDQLALENKFKSVRKEKALIHRDRTRRELQIKKAKNDLAEKRPASIMIQGKVEHLEKKIEQIQQNGNRTQNDFEQQKQHVADIENALQLLHSEESKYNDELAQTNYDQGPHLTAEQMTTYEQLKQAVNVESNKEQEQISNLQQKRKLVVQEIDRQKSKLAQLEASGVRYKDDRQQVMEHGNALTEDKLKISKQLEVRQQELSSLEQQRVDIHRREVVLNEQLQGILNQLMEAKVMQQESDKDTKFKESLAQMKQLHPGVHGALSKLCKPTQRKYGLAVSTILGRNLDAIVVDDQKTAIDCIQYLREQRLGSATFLPLNTLSIPPINDRLRNLPRASLAVDVIQCDHLYAPAVQYACGNSIICDNLASAKRICYEMGEDVKAVTLDGSVIHRSGLMTGGPSTSQNDKIWDETDVEGLMRTRDKILAELNELCRNKRMGSAEELAKSDCDGLSSRLSVILDEIKIEEQRLKDIDSSLQSIQDNMIIHQQQIAHSESALTALDNQIQQVQELVAVVEDRIFGDFCSVLGLSNIREYEASQFTVPEQVREQRAKFNTQRSRLQTQLSFDKEQLENLQGRLVKLTESLQESQQEKQRYEAELVNLGELQQQLTNDVENYQVELQKQIEQEKSKQQELDDIRLSLEERGKDMDAYLKEMAQMESKIEKIRAERAAIFRKCKLEDIRLPLISGSMDDVLMDDANVVASDASTSSSMDTSSMDIDDPTNGAILSTDWIVEVDYSVLDDDERNDNSAQLEKRYLDDLKSRNEVIEKMAPNLKAIDRLEGVEQRLGDMEDEYKSARKVAETAKEKFDKVKNKRRSLFQSAFTHISEHIDQVYKELTKTSTFPLGGTAYLTLEDTDEPYLKGVLYHAMPPMKRFRDMGQLSGGEKSMAALALLFAIRSYQPSPFFVLDEVDAALDNTNVKKVVGYIRRHANDQFQFIVISFKNILYERAQSLVGIYRDNDLNSSKSLTLKLDEYDEA
ncbi:RecF/RecN/SMC [Halteromyces radiatus]|uniref:RecF/RecN/SMC n=1 Tax=Halteromyces radiatus TaxID=101107 RepID=UPI00221F4A4F|nr:RecF/RecN/SMC [Halteromyces radiatus]KAI8089897.1 RecF/RecN/SMC [Halteromyces radiatus]